MPHSFSHAVSMNLEHSIKEGSHERYPDHLQCFRIQLFPSRVENLLPGFSTNLMQSPSSAWILHQFNEGPSSITARNLVEVLFLLCLSALNFWGMFVRVYPKIVQGLMFLNSVKHITTILACCTS